MERMFVSYYFPVTVCLGIWTLIGRCHTIIGSAWELENFDGSKSIQHSYTVALLFYHFYLWIKKCHLLQFSHSVMSDSLWSHGLQHARPPCPSQTLRVDSKLCPLNGWCHPAISPSVIPFSHLQSFPASKSFPMSQFFTSGGQVLEIQLQHQSFQWIFRLIPFRMDRLDLLVVQEALKSLLQHHSSKASIFQSSVFFIVQLSHPYMTTRKTIALTR